MAYTVHQAKTNFSRLLKEAEAGQEVIVMRGNKPVAKVVAINEPSSSRKMLAGSYRGLIQWDENSFDPMSDEELVECDLGYMLDVPLIPPAVRPPEK
jgi:prevent-host-death family protein